MYDRLIDPALLQWAQPGAELLDVGKEPGHHKVPQEEIGRLLLEKARAGRQVVRLKGGDPFLFGRGGGGALPSPGGGGCRCRWCLGCPRLWRCLPPPASR